LPRRTVTQALVLALLIVEAEPATAVRVRSSPNQKKKLLDGAASVFDGGGTRPGHG
jgi:hypothetical protein